MDAWNEVIEVADIENSTSQRSFTDWQKYYQQAFSRNEGIIHSGEQRRLRDACIAIPGMGGMGGTHLATLVRTGIGHFRIADFDSFEVVNTNRQYGATCSTLGRNKAEVMAEIARDINPGVQVTVFNEAIDESNVDRFLDGADIFLDALDFFNLPTRRMLFEKARQKGVYAVSALSLGFSGTLLVFSPAGMSFDTYFAFRSGMTLQEQLLSFVIGVAPGGTHLRYVNFGKIDLANGIGPSLGLACQIASSMAATEIVNILLQRRPVKAVPHYFQFDPYLMKYKKGYLWLGNRNPLQQLRLWYLKRFLLKEKLRGTDKITSRSVDSKEAGERGRC